MLWHEPAIKHLRVHASAYLVVKDVAVSSDATEVASLAIDIHGNLHTGQRVHRTWWNCRTCTVSIDPHAWRGEVQAKGMKTVKADSLADNLASACYDSTKVQGLACGNKYIALIKNQESAEEQDNTEAPIMMQGC